MGDCCAPAARPRVVCRHPPVADPTDTSRSTRDAPRPRLRSAAAVRAGCRAGRHTDPARGDRWPRAALSACLIFWIAFGLATHDWHAQGLSTLKTVFLLGYEFVRFPDAVRQV